MNRNRFVITTLLAMAMSNLHAAGPPQDPIEQLLLRPDTVLEFREQLGLTSDQLEQISSIVDETSRTAWELTSRNEKARNTLIERLNVDRIDEDAALKRFDELVAVEREQKRLHLKTMIRLRNILTAKQIRIARQLRNQSANQVVELRLKTKMRRIEKEVQSRSQQGQPPFEVVERMQEFPKLMKAGKVNSAEALLDRVLKMLDLNESAAHKNSSTEKRIPRKLPGTELKRLGPEELQADVLAMKKDNVAWRKIKWKTCLLDGLKASRDQRKPIILWVFIDRPIDDERC